MKTLVVKLTESLKDYATMAKRAVKETDGKLLVPADLDAETLQILINEPDSLCFDGDNPKEPCYLSVSEGNSRGNADGSAHKAYLVIDVIEFRILDLLDRSGQSKLRGHSLHLSGHKLGVNFGVKGHVKTLQHGMGLYVIRQKGKPVDFWASYSCRCPCLDADAFWFREDAERSAVKEKGKVVQITSEFLDKFRKELS